METMSYWSSQSLKTNTHWQSNSKGGVIYADNYISFLRLNETNYALPMIFNIDDNAETPVAVGTDGYIIRAPLDLSEYKEGTYLLNDRDIKVITATMDSRYPIVATNVCDNNKTPDGYFQYTARTYDKNEDVIYNMLIPHIKQYLIVANKQEGKTASECLSDVINREYTIHDFIHKVTLPKGSEYANENVTFNFSAYKSFYTYGGSMTYSGGKYESAGYVSIPKGGGLLNPDVSYGNACLGFTAGDNDNTKAYYFNTGIRAAYTPDGDPDKLEVVCGNNTIFSSTDRNYYETDEKYYKLVYDISSYSLQQNVTQIKRR